MAVRTIAAGGGNWNATGTWMEGIVPVLGDDVFAAVTSGQLTVNVASACTSINFTNYTNTLTMNATLSVGGNVTLVAAMTIAGTSALILTANGTFTSNGKTLSGALTINAALTITITDDLRITGLLTFNGSATQSCAITGLFNIYIGSAITFVGSGYSVSGTATFLVTTTCTWTHNSTSYLINPLTINCVANTLTFSTNGLRCGGGGTTTYLSGNIAGTKLILITLSRVLNVSDMVWTSATIQSGTVTLLSDWNIGSLTLSTTAVAINGAFNVNATNGLIISNASAFTGTATLNLLGGTWSTSFPAATNSISIVLKGDVTISGTVSKSGTLTYTSGKITVAGSTLAIIAAATLINMDKMTWNIVTVTAGTTVTMNKFFSGIPTKKTTIRSSVAGTVYTITFQDTFEKTAKFVNTSDCSLTRKGQLLMLTPNSDKGGNSGIRYINQSPNGIAKNAPSIIDPITYPSFGLAADPCFY